MRIDDPLHLIRAAHLRHNLVAAPGEQAGNTFPQQCGVVRDGNPHGTIPLSPRNNSKGIRAVTVVGPPSGE